MRALRWTSDKPTAAGWYWYRGEVGEAEPLIVEIDDTGMFQWPDGAFQEVSLTRGEWAGPIALPEEP